MTCTCKDEIEGQVPTENGTEGQVSIKDRLEGQDTYQGLRTVEGQRHLPRTE